jgi:hypothetical protein
MNLLSIKVDLTELIIMRIGRLSNVQEHY